METTNLDPSRTAVLVIDMQKAFTEPGSPICVAKAKETVPAIAKLVDQARGWGMKIFWIERKHRPDGSDLEAFRQKQLQEKGCLDLLSPSHPLFDLAVGLEAKAPDQIVYKTRFSAFYATKLEQLLKTYDIDTLVLVGTQTPNCIRATAYDAAARNYRTIVINDCTSSATTTIQKANLQDLANAGIEVLQDADELHKLLNQSL